MTHDTASPTAPRAAVTPVGLNHLVLNVRDIEESHRFWTEVLGFRQVGEIHATAKRPNPPKMRFYSGDHGGSDAALNFAEPVPTEGQDALADRTADVPVFGRRETVSS